MVAYSFKRQFVTPIRLGLSKVRNGLPVVAEDRTIYPKRQTIRALRNKRHARPGDELQLYCAQRTRHCFLIGRARCTNVKPIMIDLRREMIYVDRVCIAGLNLAEFSRSDGFESWMDMRDFWRREHPGLRRWQGVIIYWEPLKEESDGKGEGQRGRVPVRGSKRCGDRGAGRHAAEAGNKGGV